MSVARELLQQLLASPSRPHLNPLFPSFVAEGAHAAYALLERAERADEGRDFGFVLSSLMAAVGRPGLGLYSDALLSPKEHVVTIVASALGLLGLETAPLIVHQRPFAQHEYPMVNTWGFGALMNASSHDDSFLAEISRQLEHLGMSDLVLQVQAGADVATIHRQMGSQFSPAAFRKLQQQFNRNCGAYAFACLWIWSNRSRFACGTKTPHGGIGEHGLPNGIQNTKQTDAVRAQSILDWLYRKDVLGDEEFNRLEREFSGHTPRMLRAYWAFGALWSLRQLATEVVRSAQDI